MLPIGRSELNYAYSEVSDCPEN